MSPEALSARSGWVRLALLWGAGGTALLLAALLVLPQAREILAAGWLIGLLFWLGIALGALALLAAHALTGGRWGRALWPALAPAAASLPLFLLLILPLVVGVGRLYPWAGEPGHPERDVVAQLYLNLPGATLRGVVALLVWSVLALLLVGLRPGGVRRMVAALGLVFHMAATTLLGFDWVQSLEPHFHSTSFGMASLVLQLMACLAWAVLLRPAPAEAAPDVGGMLLATVLGSLYLGFSQYLVIWYGDLPEKVAWYVLRQHWGWLAVELLSLLLSTLLPLVMLLPTAQRGSPAALAQLAPWLLAGILLHQAWLVAPGAGFWALPVAALAVLAVGGLWFGLAYGLIAGRLVRTTAAGS
ncbi:hypothetical protein E0493_04295 [Roseomonas sp. M0104]|uniref:Quinol:cytochrome c oxidoreductase quinone-binding subunit 2 n=1 Tax=Teichococcus coralli TaxID=2545983 RepID=A0A845B4J2_9PROT|nr:hypothetical protein [Pseudoroseomonas coralli]MXP62573.1 hypothetical protein [Pseudoroseomonas coralli]